MSSSPTLILPLIKWLSLPPPPPPHSPESPWQQILSSQKVPHQGLAVLIANDHDYRQSKPLDYLWALIALGFLEEALLLIKKLQLEHRQNPLFIQLCFMVELNLDRQTEAERHIGYLEKMGQTDDMNWLKAKLRHRFGLPLSEEFILYVVANKDPQHSSPAG